MQALAVSPGSAADRDIMLVPSPLSDSLTLPASITFPLFAVVAVKAA
jgi:hypothetical protein